MSKYTFVDPNTGRTYSVSAPAGVSESQAQAMFKQQLDSGSLAGFDVGTALSAATQAAGGLTAAQAIVNQQAGSALGRLPVGADLNTINSALGPDALAGITQLATSLQGSSAAAKSNFVAGSPGLVAGQSGFNTVSAVVAVSGLVAKAGTAFTGAAAAVGSVANKAVSAIAASFSQPVTNGINTADLVKQGSGIGLPDLSAINTQAAMSQAAKLIGQPVNVVSNTLGVGKFGFDLNQLETAGIVKPGIAAVATATGSSISSVLASPTAFTGKDGVKSLDSLLANETLQNNIQRNLMGEGLGALKSTGIPVSNLNPQAVAGLANNAAKSVTDTLKSLQGTAPPDIKAEFDTVTRDSAYAVNFAEDKVDPAAVGEVPTDTAENTVDDETVILACDRIIGNSKVPEVLGQA